ncbi:MAG: hypothetical protein ACHQAY_05085 [Hyphomicrobiales bacterium]
MSPSDFLARGWDSFGPPQPYVGQPPATGGTLAAQLLPPLDPAATASRLGAASLGDLLTKGWSLAPRPDVSPAPAIYGQSRFAWPFPPAQLASAPSDGTPSHNDLSDPVQPSQPAPSVYDMIFAQAPTSQALRNSYDTFSDPVLVERAEAGSPSKAFLGQGTGLDPDHIPFGRDQSPFAWPLPPAQLASSPSYDDFSDPVQPSNAAPSVYDTIFAHARTSQALRNSYDTFSDPVEPSDAAPSVYDTIFAQARTSQALRNSYDTFSYPVQLSNAAPSISDTILAQAPSSQALRNSYDTFSDPVSTGQAQSGEPLTGYAIEVDPHDPAAMRRAVDILHGNLHPTKIESAVRGALEGESYGFNNEIYGLSRASGLPEILGGWRAPLGALRQWGESINPALFGHSATDLYNRTASMERAAAALAERENPYTYAAGKLAASTVAPTPGGLLVRGAKSVARGAKAARDLIKGTAAEADAIKAGTAAVQKYDVDTYRALKAKSVVGDDLEVHHAVQAKPGSQIIGGYDRMDAPAIALPAEEHKRIPKIIGTYTGTARDLVAADVRKLRKFTGAPTSSIRKLIDLNRSKYPGQIEKVK